MVNLFSPWFFPYSCFVMNISLDPTIWIYYNDLGFILSNDFIYIYHVSLKYFYWYVILLNNGKNIENIMKGIPNSVSSSIFFDKNIIIVVVLNLSSNCIQYLIIWINSTPHCICLNMNVLDCSSSILENKNRILGILSAID